ncbi:MAG: TIGR04282 family arsenosugar biosynthesis glycosyltransferase [Gemmatimonadales bacterium]|nr:TIGR04282 family arsenosugar biosynthesis glycosyltransferase [Gemmatimonadales bacterium]
MTAVAMLAKAPRPGTVKTRLARDIGDFAAAEVYRRIGRQVAVSVGSALAVTVWYDPPDAEAEMRGWLGDHEYRPQCGADLGERMRAACDGHFSQGDTPVIVIGADCPGVTAETIREAERLLAGADVAIGPSVDGGYYLLGLNRREPGIFSGVPWGTGGVLGITEAYCRDRQLAVALLPVRRDVDTIEDLVALGLERS